MTQQYFKEKAKKFYNASYQIGQQSRCVTPIKKRSELALPESAQMKRTLSAPAAFQKQVSVIETSRFEQGDHTFRNVLLFLVFAGIFIFAVDVYKGMNQERMKLQIKRKKCHDEYIENECENAVEAIREQCHELQVCFKMDPEMTLRASQSVAKLVGRLVETFMNETGWLGAIFLLIFLTVILVFIYKASKSTETFEMTLKKE